MMRTEEQKFQSAREEIESKERQVKQRKIIG